MFIPIHHPRAGFTKRLAWGFVAILVLCMMPGAPGRPMPTQAQAQQRGLHPRHRRHSNRTGSH